MCEIFHSFFGVADQRTPSVSNRNKVKIQHIIVLDSQDIINEKMFEINTKQRRKFLSIFTF